MKLLIVGSWRWKQYEEAFAKSLTLQNVTVEKFSTSRYLSGPLSKYIELLPLPVFKIILLNQAIKKQVLQSNIDAVLFWRPTHIFPSTIIKLNKNNINTISYNNDDPFGPWMHNLAPWHHKFLWYWYFKCLPYFKKNFFYRETNCLEAKSLGIKHASLLMPYFIPLKDRPIELNQQDRKRFLYDVVFIGHYEKDGREKYINALVRSNINFKLWGGTYWTKEILKEAYDLLPPIQPVYGEDYNKAINGSKIALCFLSKLNRDQYTRRCFEIPATGTVLLSERTEALSSLFIENQEAVFFSTPAEMIEKIQWLLNNPVILQEIAQAGMRKSWAAGYDIDSRTQEFLQSI